MWVWYKNSEYYIQSKYGIILSQKLKSCTLSNECLENFMTWQSPTMQLYFSIPLQDRDY